MTKKELANLHKMQKDNPISEIIGTALQCLWQIGCPAGIPKICCYEEMILQIVISPDVSESDKRNTLRTFEEWSRTAGKLEERRNTCFELNVSWYEN